MAGKRQSLLDHVKGPDRCIEAFLGPIRQISFIPESHQILCLGENDGDLTLSDLPDLRWSPVSALMDLQNTFKLRSFAFTFANNSPYFAFGDLNGHIETRRPPTFDEDSWAVQHPFPIHFIRINSTNTRVPIATEGEVFCGDPQDPQLVHEDVDPDHNVLFLEFGPICQTLVVFTADSVVPVYRHSPATDQMV
jgi:hypothetical protein